MPSTPATWSSRLRAVPYRELIDAPGVGRAHDLQRLLSYGLGVALSLVTDLPQWRAVFVFGISAIMVLATVRRLVTGPSQVPYVTAMVDQVVATSLVALATGSPLITLGAIGVIVMAIAATFETTPAMTAGSAVLTIGIAGPLVLAIDSGPSGVSGSMMALVLIVLLLAIAVLILVFFTVQARYLRSTLHSREQQLSSVLAVTPVVLATVDQDGLIMALAGDVRGWLGLPGDHIPQETDVGRVVAAATHGERVIDDVPIGNRVFNVTCDPGDDGTVLLTAYDITDRVEARERLEGLVRSKDQFIAAISHELRTPLSAVLGFAEEMHDAMGNDDPLRSMMEVVADQSSEMASIIEDLLVVARSSFEDVSMAPRSIDLADEAATVAEAIGSRLTKSPDHELAEAMAFADPIRVRQILRNLLTNADRYGGDAIVIRTLQAEHAAVVQICDNGAPLSDEIRDRIFLPYESSGPVRGQPAAIGMGLAVSRTLAELMKGSLVYRHEGGWSVFELRLPVSHASLALR
ncbi:MAG: HAMP domain-containing sensor histidine kinase [Acidimicrobiia bacterium]|nr:HAMP domain-containing sensor histidine kinase [Acidimicrobiia bacterium]